MLEFGIGAFLFFLLVAAVIDVGRAVWYSSTLQNAVREASRYAVVHGSASSTPVGPTDGKYSAGPPSTDSTITTQVRKYISGFSASSVTVTSSWPSGDNQSGHLVTVGASMPFNLFMNFFPAGNITLSASSTQVITH